jgi:hypothetical protein
MISFADFQGICNVPARIVLTFMGFLAVINGEVELE